MNPIKHIDRWVKTAKLPTAQVKECILTNHESKGWEASAAPLLNLIKDWMKLNTGSSILDYGCGLGRNLIPLAAAGHYVYGFDTEAMIQAARPIIEASEYTIHLYDDFQNIQHLVNASDPFNLILVSLVAQHMHPDDIRDAFSQFPKMGTSLLVTGRDWNDFVSRDQRPLATWELIDEALGESMILIRDGHGHSDHRTRLWTIAA